MALEIPVLMELPICGNKEYSSMRLRPKTENFARSEACVIMLMNGGSGLKD